MPAALRKRKSRTSTPLVGGDDSPPSSMESRPAKTQQSSLDGWVEPPIKNPTASFEDHGFARHGVLEQMAPLGVPPSAKAKHRARALGEKENGLRRFVQGKNGVTLGGEEAASTPELTPAPEPHHYDSEKPDDDEIHVALGTQDEDEDDDYVPKKNKGFSRMAKAAFRGKTPVGTQTPTRAKTPLKNGTNDKIPYLSRTPGKKLATLLKHPPLDDEQRIHIGLLGAKDLAIQKGKPHLADFLQELYDKREPMPEFDGLDGPGVIYNVLKGNITLEERNSSWYNLGRSLKRKCKNALKFGVRKTPAARRKSPAIAPISFSTSTASAHQNEPAPVPSSQGPQTDIVMEDAPTPEKTTAPESPAAPQMNPTFNPPPLPATHPSPSASRTAMESPPKQPVPVADRADDVLPDADTEVSTKAPTQAPTPAAKSSPSGTESDLSDVNEEIVKSGPPEPSKLQEQLNGHAAAMRNKKVASAAHARASKKAKARAIGKVEKKPPPTAEEAAATAELEMRRQMMAENQPARMEWNPPVSDMRFEDELMETESLTESQIAVGPPIDSNKPRRAPRAPRGSGLTLHLHSGGRRARDGHSTLPSPQPGSAATTRPTTPAIAPPAAKRLKLNNGQAARVKRSPVKNREGPIAGIAHQGGGPRALGPDDNEPGSPPSESDDWCAACKGAGEFVCCEACPRVFHFLCLDPPRREAPEGSFLCSECSTRLRPAEDHVRSFTPLAPLFKALDSTNPRAFALPADIQNFFENVEARVDGSYFERAKKIPLAKSSGYGYQKPDYLKMTDGNHKTILCVQCGNSSGGKRQMVECDFCHAFWHLDCCDPPLANPPSISLEATQRDAWKCPRHVDHDFRSGHLLQNDLNATDGDDVDMFGGETTVRVARKVRKPKNAQVEDVAFTRGNRNNGFIEIINDPKDDTDGEGNYDFGPDELDEAKDRHAKVFRIPEKGVILDFVHKVKAGRISKAKDAHRDAERRKATMNNFMDRPFKQQQTALALAQLACREQDVGLHKTNIDALLLSLTAEAPTDVVSAMSATSGDMTKVEQLAELQRMQDLIARTMEQVRSQT